MKLFALVPDSARTRCNRVRSDPFGIGFSKEHEPMAQNIVGDANAQGARYPNHDAYCEAPAPRRPLYRR